MAKVFGPNTTDTSHMGSPGRPIYGASNTTEGNRLKGLAGAADSRFLDARGSQAEVMDHYRDAVEGRGGPSLAEMQMQEGMQQAGAMGAQMAASGRGGNRAGAQMMAGQAAGGAGAQAAQQGAMLRAQEQGAALQGMGAMATQMAGQDLTQQMAMEGQLGAANQAQLQSDLHHQLETRRLAEMEKQGRFDRGMQVMDTVGSVIGGVGGAMMSDVNSKQKLQAGNMTASQAVGELEPVTYEYKPGFGEPGQRIGIVAQDLEQTPAGQSIVKQTPYGKAVDIGGMSSLALASTADQEQRIRELEDALAKQDRGNDQDQGPPVQLLQGLGQALSDRNAKKDIRKAY